MATSVVPALIDALVAQATTALAGTALVFDGFKMADDSTEDTLMIGVDDGLSSSAASTADSSQSMATMGSPRSRDQAGSINCYALTWNGDSDQKAARDAAYAMQAAVENILRTDPTLGVGQPGRMVCQLGDERLEQNQNTEGAEALLVFTVNFIARI